jgi:hypothetical protein
MLFNQWITVGKGHPEGTIAKDMIYQAAPRQAAREEFNLEEQIHAFETPVIEQLYRTHSIEPQLGEDNRQIYSGSEQQQSIYRESEDKQEYIAHKGEIFRLS